MTNSEEILGTNLNKDTLKQYLEKKIGPTTTFSLSQQQGGSSNETIFIQWNHQEFVLRCGPKTEPVPYLLHDVLREYEALLSLQDSEIPVPKVISYEDASVLGAEFYLMECIDGMILGGNEPQQFTEPDQRQRIGQNTIDTLASLHSLNPESVPLRPVLEENISRAIKRHTEHLEQALTHTTEQRALPRVRDIGDWLKENIPEPPETTIVHGDFKPDNIFVNQDLPPQIAAIIDWEMAGIGNPLADLGWFLVYWHEEKDPDPITTNYKNRFEDHELYPTAVKYIREHSTFMKNQGYPSRRKLINRYETQIGIKYQNDQFYRVLALYKLITICENFYKYQLTNPGVTKETYPLMELLVPLLVERAALIIDSEAPL